MARERTLKVLLVVLGLLFSAGIYPLILSLYREPALSMMLSLYVALGVFLLIASANPSEHRSLIAFTAWSSLAHATVMTVQSYRLTDQRMHLLIGSAVLAVIGLALIALSPAKRPEGLASTARA
jgi:FtsH-binding integral membrane protein